MKTSLLNVFILLGLQMSVSGCFEMEFPDYTGGWGGSSSGSTGGYWDYNFVYEYGPSFTLDSVKQVNKTTITVWARLNYDSLLIIKSRKILYAYTSSSGDIERITEEFQLVPDTIDFTQLPDSILNWQGRKEWMYKFSLSVDSLKPGIEYLICSVNEFGWNEELRAETCYSIQLH